LEKCDFHHIFEKFFSKSGNPPYENRIGGKFRFKK